MIQIVYATTNQGKFDEVYKLYAAYDMRIYFPEELGIKIDVDETGSTLEENARLKAEAYLQVLSGKSITIGDDTGLEIDALGGKPGITVRRWKGYKMQDEEIIEYALEQLKGVPQNKRTARFHTVFAVASAGREVQYFHGSFDGEILERPRSERVEGMPFFPLFYIPELHMTLGEFHQLPIEQVINYPTHREKAALAALPYLRQLTGQTSDSHAA